MSLNPILSKMFILFVALMPLVGGFESIIDSPYQWKIWWSMIGISVFIVLMAFENYNKHKALYYSNLFIPILLFVSWSAISLFWVINTQKATSIVVQFTSYLLVFILGLFFFENKKNIYLFAKFISISLFLVALLGLAQNYFSNSSLIMDLYFQTGSMGSTFGNRNMAVQFVIITIPFLFSLFILSDKTLQIYTYSFIIFTVFLYLINSAARQGYVAIIIIIISLSLFFILDNLKNKGSSIFMQISSLRIKVYIVLIIGVLLMLVTNFSPRDSDNKLDRFISISEASGNARIPVWINTLEIIKDNPIIGVGAGQWNEYYRLYYNKAVFDKHSGEKVRFNDAHNDYLETFANYGLIGFSILMWIVFLTGRSGLVMLSNPMQNDRIFILASMLGLLGFSIVALVSFPINWYVPGFFVMLYLSIIAAYSENNNFFVKVKSGFFIVVFSLLTFLFLMYYVFISYQSEYHFRLSILNFNSNSKSQSIVDIKKSLQYKKHAKSYAKSGEYLLSVNKPKEAIGYLIKAKNETVFNVSLLLNLAEAYRVIGLYENEQSTLESILHGDDKNVIASARLVRSFFSMDKYTEANPFYKKMKVNFDYFKDVKAYGPYHWEASKTALLVGDYKYFSYIYDDLIKIDPTAENYAVYGIVEYQRVGNKSKAKMLLGKAIEFDSKVQIPEKIREDLGLGL